MTKIIDLANVQDLNVGNSYTYTILAADRGAYTSYALETAGTVTITDGTNTLTITVGAHEEIRLNATVLTIISNSVTNKLYFLY